MAICIRRGSLSLVLPTLTGRNMAGINLDKLQLLVDMVSKDTV